MTPFWMICRRPTHPGARTEPKSRFPSEADARAEAQALADSTDADFVILQAIEVVRPAHPSGHTPDRPTTATLF